MKQDFTIWRNQILQNPRDISPLKFGISQDEVIEIFGNPDAVSTMRSDGKPLILKYHDIELHFDRKAPHGLYLVYSDDEIELSITDHHEELLQPITRTEPVDNEFFLQDGAIYFSGLYENGLLKGVLPKDFCCWHYWGKSSADCFLGGIRLRGAGPGIVSGVKLCLRDGQNSRLHYQRENPRCRADNLPGVGQWPERFGCATGICKGQPAGLLPQRRRQGEDHQRRRSFSFRSLGDTYFARDENGSMLTVSSFPRRSALMGIAQSLVFPRCQAGVLPQPGD